MLKFLYPRVDWGTVRFVGCDMDGTLYDEADFIAQAYRPIANILAGVIGTEADVLHAWMLRRWIEKGSSYPHIFSEAISGCSMPTNDADKVIARCLQVFRNFKPRLTLPIRVKTILDALQASHTMFLISDGSIELQKLKFESLRLSRWFAPTNVGISGCYGPEFRKPSTKILGKIKVMDKVCEPRQVLFFGDRAVDEQFAAKAGFQFVQVACMHPLIEH